MEDLFRVRQMYIDFNLNGSRTQLTQTIKIDDGLTDSVACQERVSRDRKLDKKPGNARALSRDDGGKEMQPQLITSQRMDKNQGCPGAVGIVVSAQGGQATGPPAIEAFDWVSCYLAEWLELLIQRRLRVWDEDLRF